MQNALQTWQLMELLTLLVCLIVENVCQVSHPHCTTLYVKCKHSGCTSPYKHLRSWPRWPPCVTEKFAKLSLHDKNTLQLVALPVNWATCKARSVAGINCYTGSQHSNAGDRSVSLGTTWPCEWCSTCRGTAMEIAWYVMAGAFKGKWDQKPMQLYLYVFPVCDSHSRQGGSINPYQPATSYCIRNKTLLRKRGVYIRNHGWTCGIQQFTIKDRKLQQVYR